MVTIIATILVFIMLCFFSSMTHHFMQEAEEEYKRTGSKSSKTKIYIGIAIISIVICSISDKQSQNRAERDKVTYSIITEMEGYVDAAKKLSEELDNDAMTKYITRIDDCIYDFYDNINSSGVSFDDFRNDLQNNFINSLLGL